MKRIIGNSTDYPTKSLFFRGVALLVLILSVCTSNVIAQHKFPVPSGNLSQLFYLQRTPNTNTIVYELNEKNGVLDTKDPVHVFWIRYGDKGEQAELSYIQRRFAYGLNARLIDKDKYELRFVSYKKYVLYLMKAKDNKFHVYATINGKLTILNRIFIHIKSGGSFWSPNIDYVELNAYDSLTGAPVTGTIKV
ncbi:MAG: DUF4833 domain-containing protein [Chitinophagaceae bacterium]|nr:DUF4833 domain-containing protein [Chitinophagaceae bacterium]